MKPSAEKINTTLATTTDSHRPNNLQDFIGQNNVVSNLKIFMQSARIRKIPLDHVLLHGPPGLGKTTLSKIIADTMGSSHRQISGPALTKVGDLAAILTNFTRR